MSASVCGFVNIRQIKGYHAGRLEVGKEVICYTGIGAGTKAYFTPK